MVADLLEPIDDLAEADRLLQEAIDHGDLERAAQIAAQVAEESPSDPHAQRVASGYLTSCGRMSEALPYAQRAQELAPDNWEFALHFAILLNSCGKVAESSRRLLQLAKTPPVHPETYFQLATASEKLGFPDVAAQFAIQSRREEPRSESRNIAVAYFLARLGYADEAIELLLDFYSAETLSVPSLRALGALLGQAGRYEEALHFVDEALSLNSENPEVLWNRSWLLTQLGLKVEALGAALRAVELDPENRSSRRHVISLLVENGDVDEALRHGGALLALAPDESEYLSCMAYLIEAKSMRSAVRDYESIASLKQSATPRALRLPTTFAEQFDIQVRSVFALVLRDLRSRYGDSRLGFFWTLMEPFVHVGFLALVFQFTMHGHPPLGENFFFFYFTGVMPYLLMSHLVGDIGNVVKGNKNLLQIAQVTPFDLIVSKAIVDIFTALLVYLIFSVLFAIAGVNAMPVSLPLVGLAFLLATGLGLGVGMICTVLFEFGPAAESVVGIVLRALYFASGIFYVPSAMPVFARDILAYNPFLHVIDSMRMGYFLGYDPPWNDPVYAAVAAVAAIALGMSVVKAMSRRMRSIH